MEHRNGYEHRDCPLRRGNSLLDWKKGRKRTRTRPGGEGETARVKEERDPQGWRPPPCARPVCPAHNNVQTFAWRQRVECGPSVGNEGPFVGFGSWVGMGPVQGQRGGPSTLVHFFCEVFERLVQCNGTYCLGVNDRQVGRLGFDERETQRTRG